MAACVERIAPVAERREITRPTLLAARDGRRARARRTRDGSSQALLNLAHNAVKYSHPAARFGSAGSATDDGSASSSADDGIGIR